jgi:hypothetical protein
MMTTRTRPKSLSASRRKRRPALECLEEKQLLSIVFGSDSTGTYAFDYNAGQRSQISSQNPVAMHEGADGTLFLSFAGNGTWRYDYGSRQWTELTSWVANVMSAATDNSLYASFSGQGTWELNGGSWTELASHDAYNLAAVNSSWVYASFGGTRYGTWSNEGGSWTQIASHIPVAMDAIPDGTMYASFSTGTYEDNGHWTKITPDVANAIAAISDQEMIASFADKGTYEYDDDYGQWVGSGLQPEVATQLGHSGSTVIMSLSGVGTYANDINIWYYKYVGGESYLVA